MKYAAVYLIFINAVTVILYAGDKYRSVHRRYRIPESVLMWCAALGGSPAALAAMHIFHHKTHKPKFYVGVPLILVLHLAAAALIVYGVYIR